MLKHQPRGIIKWAPFVAIKEHQDCLVQLHIELNKLEKRKLSEDAVIEMNQIITAAFIDQKPVKLTIFDEGFYVDLIGVIREDLITSLRLTNGIVIEKKLIQAIQALE
ncbi:MAG: YolD-like family protein [Mycoplasmatales bacterium]